MNALVLRQLGAYLGQIPLLFVEADSLPGLLVGLSTLLQGRVVQLAAQREGALQIASLGLGGVQAVLERLPSTPSYYFLYTKYLLANFCRASCTVNCHRTVT